MLSSTIFMSLLPSSRLLCSLWLGPVTTTLILPSRAVRCLASGSTLDMPLLNANVSSTTTTEFESEFAATTPSAPSTHAPTRRRASSDGPTNSSRWAKILEAHGNDTNLNRRTVTSRPRCGIKIKLFSNQASEPRLVTVVGLP